MAGMVAGLAAGLMLTGCAPLLGGSGTPSVLYDLDAPTAFDAGPVDAAPVIVVEEPVADRALDSDRIAIRTDAHAIRYLAGVRWADRAPRLLQGLMVETFENAGLAHAAGRQTLAVPADLVLVSELRDFEARLPGAGSAGAGSAGAGTAGGETAAAPVVHVRLAAKLVSPRTRKVVAARRFEAHARAESDRPGDVVGALNAATGQVLTALAAWVAAQPDPAS